MNLHEFHFIRPFWLLAVIPYLLILAALLHNRLSQANWAAVCDAALLPYLLQDKAVGRSRWPLIVGALAAFLAIIAMAGPSWQRLPAPVFRNDSALVIALDLSRSMNAEDIKPSRLVRARYKIADMLKLRKDGQTALLVYAGDAFTVTPLTNDVETIVSQLEALTTDIMPSPGRNTAAALTKALALFKQAGLHKGQIVLVSDDVDLETTLPIARKLGAYSLSVLGVGTQEGAPIALPSGGFLKDSQGSIAVPKLNVSDLAKLADSGNGLYHTLTANDADIRLLLAKTNRPERSNQVNEDNPMVFELWDDKGPWILLLVLPLAALIFRKGLISLALLLILPFPEPGYAVGLRDLWLSRDQQGAKEYQLKNYEEASRLFENPDWKLAAQYKAGQPIKGEMKTPTTATGFYNLGNVLAKSGRLEEAMASYQNSLEIDPGNEDAVYNKKIVEQELEKQKKEQKQDQNQNKQAKNDEQQSSDEDKQNQNSDAGKNNGDGRKEMNSADNKAGPKSEQQEQQESSAEQKPLQPNDEQAASKINQGAEPGQNEEQESGDQNRPAVAETRTADEQQQANEQWLGRIPDDPAGLLRRKFKYQYGQRQDQP